MADQIIESHTFTLMHSNIFFLNVASVMRRFSSISCWPPVPHSRQCENRFVPRIFCIFVKTSEIIDEGTMWPTQWVSIEAVTVTVGVTETFKSIEQVSHCIVWQLAGCRRYILYTVYQCIQFIVSQTCGTIKVHTVDSNAIFNCGSRNFAGKKWNKNPRSHDNSWIYCIVFDYGRCKWLWVA